MDFVVLIEEPPSIRPKRPKTPKLPPPKRQKTKQALLHGRICKPKYGRQEASKIAEEKAKQLNHSKKLEYQLVNHVDAAKEMKRLPLNAAIQQGTMDGWSDARACFMMMGYLQKRAYLTVDTNPNAYYYRFNAPGKEQRVGRWTDEEEKLFLKRMEEIGCDGNWGVFSMTIPGRVGYQCSGFYRSLIRAGRIKDPNYEFHNGKLRYKFKDGVKGRQPRARGAPILVPTTPSMKDIRELKKILKEEHSVEGGDFVLSMLQHQKESRQGKLTKSNRSGRIRREVVRFDPELDDPALYDILQPKVEKKPKTPRKKKRTQPIEPVVFNIVEDEEEGGIVVDNSYEVQRQERIEANRKYLQELGLA